MATVTVQYWTRIVRVGNKLTIYASETGFDWTEIGEIPIDTSDFDIKWYIEVEEEDSPNVFQPDNGLLNPKGDV